MREAIGSTFLFKLMIIFIFFFTSFLAITINYSQAFRVKNQLINIIEQYEGHTTEANEKIIEMIKSTGYRRTIGGCSDDAYALKDSDNKVVPGICIKKISTGTGNLHTYYQVTTYVSFNFPIIGNVFTLPVKGETKSITNAKHDY